MDIFPSLNNFISKYINKEVIDELRDNFYKRRDNILFNENGVSVILDFDRNHYSYIWMLIGRAILSFALEKIK